MNGNDYAKKLKIRRNQYMKFTKSDLAEFMVVYADLLDDLIEKKYKLIEQLDGKDNFIYYYLERINNND